MVHNDDSTTTETNGESYVDYASVHEYDTTLNNAKPNATRSILSTDDTFPVKLHYLLNELEKDGKSDIIHWLPHGRAFIVDKRKVLEETILPLWFQQSKFASFQRQLNIYGFHRITKGRDKGGYYNSLFLRGKLFLARRMKRNHKKGNGPRKPDSMQTDPDFYAMHHLPEAATAASNGHGVAPVSSTFASSVVRDSVNGMIIQGLIESQSIAARVSLQNLMTRCTPSISNINLLLLLDLTRFSHLVDTSIYLLLSEQFQSNLEGIPGSTGFDGASGMLNWELIDLLVQKTNGELLGNTLHQGRP